MNHVIDRQAFLRALNEVKPGLSVRDILEQSASFAFLKGKVVTFNDEVMCTANSGLPPEFTGVVRAKMLLTQVQKAEDDNITVSDNGQEVLLAGKRWRCGLARDPQVLLDLKKVSMPKKEDWFPVAEDFCEAVQLVETCAGKDQQQFVLTCVHIHPKWVEATDNQQIARFRCNTGVPEPVLVRRDSLRPVPQYDITRMAVHDNWVHFRASNRTTISMARFVDKYHDLSSFFTQNGVPVVLPKTLADLSERAKLISDETEEDRVLVTLTEGRVKVSARCDGAWYEAAQVAKYKGPKFTFLVAPKMLVSLVDKYPDCLIDTDEYRIQAGGGGKFRYAACLEASLNVTSQPKEGS